jgi:broad specificity phosphatase PhoE
MTQRTWYLVRHGETEWNAARRMQGQNDSRLTPEGHLHAAQSGELLARLGVDEMYASPLGRVRQSLTEIAAYVHLAHAPTFDDRLKEWSSGDWSGFLYSEVQERWPTEYAAWEADRHSVRSPNGENFIDLRARAQAFLDDIAHSKAQRIAIVAHGFLNRALAACLLDLAPAQTLEIRQPNNVVMRIRTGEGPPVADHFAGGQGPRPGLPQTAPAGHVA